MSELPAGWVNSVLDDIALQITKGTTPTTIGFSYEAAGIPFVKIENIENKKINKDSITQFISQAAHTALLRSQLYEHDILFSIAGTIGKTALVTKADLPANTNQAVAIIRAPEGLISHSFLQHQLSSLPQEFLAEMSRGGAMNNVSLGDIKSFGIKIPPLDEQTRIAQKLDELLAQVDTLKARIDAIPTLLRRFRQSVLTAAVSGRLTEEWRAQYMPLSHALENNGWQILTADEVAASERHSLAIGPFGSNLKVSDYKENGHPLVFVREVRAEFFGDAKTKFVSSEKFEELYAHQVRSGDLLITKMGDPPGDVAIYPADAPEAIITADCIKLRVNNSLALREFVYFQMKSELFKQKVIDISAGVAQQKVSLGKFRYVPLLIPSIEEQTEIVRRVEQLFAFADQLEAKVASAKSRIDHLTQSILAKAFRGELVPQDPNDEPASVLLERIKAQRAAAPKAKRERRVSTL